MVDVLVLTLGPAEKLLPVKDRVAATTEVALQFGDASVDIVVGLNVQSSSHRAVQSECSAERRRPWRGVRVPMLSMARVRDK